ncbi:hypothetical protein BHM03_00002682 [Ensete ventricosum]|nr:hypothetical protein BHM03_00002682 [Ensete ventricosum]
MGGGGSRGRTLPHGGPIPDIVFTHSHPCFLFLKRSVLQRCFVGRSVPVGPSLNYSALLVHLRCSSVPPHFEFRFDSFKYERGGVRANDFIDCSALFQHGSRSVIDRSEGRGGMGRDWSWSTRPSPGRGDREEINPVPIVLHSAKVRTEAFASIVVRDREVAHHALYVGLEAPRNSLELGEEEASSAVKGELYDVPVSYVVCTDYTMMCNNKMTVFLEDEKRSSQAETPRTPSVIARLMGLEIPAEQCLSPMTPDTPPFMEPQAQSRMTNKRRHVIGDGCGRESPSPRNPLRSLNCSNVSAPPPARTVDVVGSRSLPETPRVSSTGSRDVEARLSLQLNKENTHEAVHGFGSSSADYPLPSAAYAARSRKKDHGRHHDENKSPRSLYHAREIVQQVKESFNNRRGGGGDSGSGGDEIFHLFPSDQALLGGRKQQN